MDQINPTQADCEPPTSSRRGHSPRRFQPSPVIHAPRSLARARMQTVAHLTLFSAPLARSSPAPAAGLLAGGKKSGKAPPLRSDASRSSVTGCTVHSSLRFGMALGRFTLVENEFAAPIPLLPSASAWNTSPTTTSSTTTTPRAPPNLYAPPPRRQSFTPPTDLLSSSTLPPFRIRYDMTLVLQAS